ncbi:ribonuclease H-like domain-containing protein [Tanacetum coccineum]
MVTRSQSGIVKPIERLSLHTSSLSPIPKSPFIALKDPNWCNVMYDEYNALVKNASWILVTMPSNVDLVRSMWLFKHKFHADGTLRRYKACLVANSMYMHQPPGFVDSRYPNHVCLLVLTVCKGSQVAYLLIYVDDIILTASSPVLLQQIVDSLNKEFDMTDLGELNYFLGISAIHHPTGLFLS